MAGTQRIHGALTARFGTLTSRYKELLTRERGHVLKRSRFYTQTDSVGYRIIFVDSKRTVPFKDILQMIMILTMIITVHRIPQIIFSTIFHKPSLSDRTRP